MSPACMRSTARISLQGRKRQGEGLGCTAIWERWEYDFVRDEIVVYDHMSDKAARIQFHTSTDGHGGGDQVLMQNFVDLISGREKESVSPLSAGIWSARVCLAAKAASETEMYQWIREGDR